MFIRTSLVKSLKISFETLRLKLAHALSQMPDGLMSAAVYIGIAKYSHEILEKMSTNGGCVMVGGITFKLRAACKWLSNPPWQ